jgi:hypothetical protein
LELHFVGVDIFKQEALSTLYAKIAPGAQGPLGQLTSALATELDERCVRENSSALHMTFASKCSQMDLRECVREHFTSMRAESRGERDFGTELVTELELSSLGKKWRGDYVRDDYYRVLCTLPLSATDELGEVKEEGGEEMTRWISKKVSHRRRILGVQKVNKTDLSLPSVKGFK